MFCLFWKDGKVSSCYSSFAGKSTGLLIEHFDFILWPLPVNGVLSSAVRMLTGGLFSYGHTSIYLYKHDRNRAVWAKRLGRLPHPWCLVPIPSRLKCLSSDPRWFREKNRVLAVYWAIHCGIFYATDTLQHSFLPYLVLLRLCCFVSYFFANNGS